MSRRIAKILGALILLLSLIIVTALQAAPPQQDNSSAVAKLTVIAGTVQILAPDSEAWEIVAETADLISDSRVRTDFMGIASIQWFDDNTRLEVLPNSEIFVNEFTIASDTEFTIEITQFLGETAHCIDRQLQPNMRYIVNTASVKMSANQSQYGVALNENYQTTIGISSGALLAEHQQSDAQVILAANDVLIVPLQSSDFASIESLASLDEAFVGSICNSANLSPVATQEPADGPSPVITQEPADGGPVQTPEPIDDNDDDDDDSGGGGNSGPGGGGDRDDDDDD